MSKITGLFYRPRQRVSIRDFNFYKIGTDERFQSGNKRVGQTCRLGVADTGPLISGKLDIYRGPDC